MSKPYFIPMILTKNIDIHPKNNLECLYKYIDCVKTNNVYMINEIIETEKSWSSDYPFYGFTFSQYLMKIFLTGNIIKNAIFNNGYDREYKWAKIIQYKESIIINLSDRWFYSIDMINCKEISTDNNYYLNYEKTFLNSLKR